MTDTLWTPGPWRTGPRSKTNLYADATGQFVANFLRVEDALLALAAPEMAELLEWACTVDDFEENIAADLQEKAGPLLARIRGES